MMRYYLIGSLTGFLYPAQRSIQAGIPGIPAEKSIFAAVVGEEKSMQKG
jgi:hypothetical protein